MQQSSPSQGALARMGATRLCLLVTFLLLSLMTYLYLDTHTIELLLLKVQKNPYGTMHLFLAAFALSVVLLFPCMIVQVMSGALYGFWMGLLVSWLGTSIGQCLAFLLGRYLLRPSVKAYLHSTWPNFPTIDAAIKKEGWKLVCLLRLSPVLPYNMLNYALAVTPVSFFVFSVASAVSTIPWTALYVYLGTLSNNLMDLAHGRINMGDDMQLTRTILSGLFIVVTTVYGYQVSHRAIISVLKDVGDQEQSKEESEILLASAHNSNGSSLNGSMNGSGAGLSNGGGPGQLGSLGVIAGGQGTVVSGLGKYLGAGVGGLAERGRDLELGR